MQTETPQQWSRRRFGRAAAAMSAFYAVPGLFADQLELALTPGAAEGPYYPDRMPLDVDNDLIVMNDAATPALGQVAHITGKVTTTTGESVRNATVEIWQVCANGVYIHTRAPGQQERDANFQGFGRFETGSTGEYRFRTIVPAPYVSNNRTAPHIHYAVNLSGRRILTTQLFVKDHPMNEGDSVIRNTARGGDASPLFAEFEPLQGSRIGEYASRFDLVVDPTSEGRSQGGFSRGGFGRGRSGRRRG